MNGLPRRLEELPHRDKSCYARFEEQVVFNPLLLFQLIEAWTRNLYPCLQKSLICASVPFILIYWIVYWSLFVTFGMMAYLGMSVVSQYIRSRKIPRLHKVVERHSKTRWGGRLRLNFLPHHVSENLSGDPNEWAFDSDSLPYLRKGFDATYNSHYVYAPWPPNGICLVVSGVDIKRAPFDECAPLATEQLPFEMHPDDTLTYVHWDASGRHDDICSLLYVCDRKTKMAREARRGSV